MKKIKKADYAAALRFANKIRMKQKRRPLKKLPPGIPNEPCDCPIARATGLVVLHSYAFEPDNRTSLGITLPKGARRFIVQFDALDTDDTGEELNPGKFL